MTSKRCSVAPAMELIVRATALGILRFVEDSPLLDSRGLLGTAKGRTLLVDVLVPHLREHGTDIVLGGVANAGSVLGTLLADRLDLDFVNVLVDGPRSGGLRRQLEPEKSVGRREVLLVDNWVSSGTSLLKAAGIVQSAGGEVAGALTISARPDFPTETFPIPLHLGIPLPRLAGEQQTAGRKNQ